MSALRLTVPAVKQYLLSSKRRTVFADGKREVVLLRSAPQWDGPADVDLGGGRRIRVVAAVSVLAIHELVLDHLAGQDGPAVLVVLTDQEPSDLDQAILARTHRYRIHAVDGWKVVQDKFGASAVDPRLRALPWAAEALLDATPPEGWPQVPGGVLSSRTALSLLAQRRLRLGRYAPADEPADATGIDVHALLRWSLRDGAPATLLSLRAPERDGLTAFLGEDDQAGTAARALLALVAAGHGPDAVPFGLVCAALWRHAPLDAGTLRAQGRAERWFGDEPPASGTAFDELVGAFGRACEEFVVSVRDGTVLRRAATLTRQFAAETAARHSPVLDEGLAARFATLGAALKTLDAMRSDAALRDLADHRRADEPGAKPRIGRAAMAVRLVRWLGTEPSADIPTVGAGIERHITETGWVDRALTHLTVGDPELQAAYDRIAGRVRERRTAIDRSFALAIAAGPGPALTAGTFPDRVVRPLTTGRSARRVLLVLLTGTDAASAAEAADELRREWAEFDPVPNSSGSTPRRRGMWADGTPHLPEPVGDLAAALDDPERPVVVVRDEGRLDGLAALLRAAADRDRAVLLTGAPAAPPDGLAGAAVPVLAFLPFGADPPKGWRELGDQRPAWWRDEAPPPPARPRSRRRPVPPPGAAPLFDVAAPDPVDALLASEIFTGQLELVARKPSLAKFRTAVQALLDDGTLPVTALAQRIGLPASRAPGFAAILAQVLNYDGAQVLERLPDGRTVRLNRALLREQFEL
ncbi:BREX-2 system phosphatase PglZ [Actinomadura rayongensis]|uniref:BREX-2 system phosphatase PglZ n=1 Tax=Actinomadura rayongensis TaxID=1429076 RepID=A0A6I4W344_9ACTN|nr:BREX-2 system phosphatase PglZ [Actinomadura rayongensis]MXQ65079.1 BREX-2 system phosphatase PglZ [Actinomadura rayongensis]